ncbi:MAG: serine--tRNA ligase, partial [Actinobacteria bacterium]|nr:serine--tRNA ligase [Actinomycetota bacterium]
MKQAVTNRGMEADVDGILALDERRRGLLVEVEELKHERNRASDE